MKKIYVILIALIVVVSSCQKSQFSTTTRQYKNGKVSYVNTYHKEHSKTSKGKSRKNNLTEADAQKSIPDPNRKGMQNFAEPETIKIIPALIPAYENLIASTSNEPTIIWMNKEQVRFTNDLILSYHSPHGIRKDIYRHDTIKFIAPQQGTTMDFSAEYVIRLKNGSKKRTGLIYQSHDTLFYKLISNPRITNFVSVEQVDTIFKVKYYDSTKGQVVETRKSVDLGTVGLIFSFLGIMPFVGLPFALAAVILGAVSLRKIKRHPEQYRGINNANASIILGILGIAITTIILIALAISGYSGVSMGMGQ